MAAVCHMTTWHTTVEKVEEESQWVPLRFPLNIWGWVYAAQAWVSAHNIGLHFLFPCPSSNGAHHIVCVPPQAAASTQDPPKVAAPAPVHESSLEHSQVPEFSPVLVPAPELFACPVSTTEATLELLAYPVMATDVMPELSACPVTDTGAVSKLSVLSVSVLSDQLVVPSSACATVVVPSTVGPECRTRDMSY